MGAFGEAIRFCADNLGLLASKSLEHLEVSASALAIALAIAVPLGVVLGHLHRGSLLAVGISNIGRALPSLAVIAIGIALLGIGKANVIVALVVLAVPVVLTAAHAGIDGVDREIVDAARGMGMGPLAVIVRIELPLALPLLFAGIRTAAVYVIATATLAAIAGGGGLRDIIVNQASYGQAGVLAGAIAVAALALAAELAFAALEAAVTPRGLRLASAGDASEPGPEAAPRAAAPPTGAAE